MKEEWRIIEEFPDYEVSNFGRVWSNKLNRLLIISIYKKNFPYMVVNLLNKKGSKTQFVHRLVLFAFKGKPKEGQVCNHIDGNRSNNIVLNLEWVTQRENLEHARRIGLTKTGEDMKQWVKLSNKDVLRIKKLRENGVSRKVVADFFKVHPIYISRITGGVRRRFG